MVSKDKALKTTSYTQSIKCQHKNGWYADIKFWMFTRRIFLCSDCGEVLYDK